MSTSTRTENVEALNRRQFLRASGGALAVASVASGASRPAVAQADPLDEWFADVDNYDGVVDRTGESEVRVQVGTAANGGAFGFGPAAVQVDPGATVVWEWTGEGGVHNVAETGGTFESELLDEPGATFEHTFDAEGVFRYACTPHQAMGMKGAVVVGDAGTASGGEASADGSGAGPDGGVSIGTDELLTGGLAGAILVALFVLPLAELRKRRGRPS